MKPLKKAFIDGVWENLFIYSFKIVYYLADSVLGAQTAGVKIGSLGPVCVHAGDRHISQAVNRVMMRASTRDRAIPGLPRGEMRASESNHRTVLQVREWQKGRIINMNIYILVNKYELCF